MKKNNYQEFFLCLCVFVAKTPTRSKFTRHFSLDLETIFVTKSDYFCHKAANNLRTLFGKSIYKLRETYNDYFNNRLFFQLKSHTLYQVDQTLKTFNYRFYRLSHNRHNFCIELRSVICIETSNSLNIKKLRSERANSLKNEDAKPRA